MSPPFRADGYLPEGLHPASEAEVTFRLGSATPRRRWLALRLRRWIALAGAVRARRLLVDGSFVTTKPEPDDVDAVVLLPADFADQVHRGIESAVKLGQVLLARQPEESFGAEDELDWDAWFDFFSRTRESDDRCKGLVEVQL